MKTKLSQKIAKSVLIMVIATFSINQTVWADSPLTSIDIAEAYQDVPIIAIAANANGLITIELMDYLIDKKNPIAVKMAVINKLGWNTNGQQNADIFFKYVLKKRGYTDNEEFMRKATGDELLCMAYLKALDNYFEVDDAIIYANKALHKNKKSYTFNIITAIIIAQKQMDIDWCEVYKQTNCVRDNKKLKKDMNETAIYAIFEYMDLYKTYCG